MNEAVKVTIASVVAVASVCFIFCLVTNSISGFNHKEPERHPNGSIKSMNCDAFSCSIPDCTRHPKWSIQLGKFVRGRTN